MPVIEDIQQWSITAATNASADPGINWAEHMPRADVNNSARSVMAAVAKQRNLTNGSITTTGTAAAQTFATGMSYVSVPTNMRVVLKMGFTSATDLTLNMDGIGAAVVKDLYGNNLKQGLLPINSFAEFIHNGTNWILLGLVQSVAGVTDGTSAAVGMVGEVLSGASGIWAANVGTTGSIASVNLTAGDWSVWGVIVGTGTPSGFVTLCVGPIVNSLASGLSFHGIYAGPGSEFGGGTTPMTVNISAAATYHLTIAIGSGSFSGTASSASIFARRMH